MDGIKDARGASLHDRDFYSWTQEQAKLLRDGRLDRLDLANLTEEIETLGRSELSSLRSSYKLIAMHLLKLMVKPAMATNIWTLPIKRERGNVEDLLEENPGLKPKRRDTFLKAYASARRDAAAETNLSIAAFPIDAPFEVEQIEDPDYWPTA